MTSYLLSLPSNLLSLIVRLIAVAKNKEALAAIANFSETNTVMRSAKDASAKIDIFASILALAPVRAVPTKLILRYMKDNCEFKDKATFADRLVRIVLEEPSTALMPRIAELARDPTGARLADALHARLVASLRTSTVNGDSMYGAALETLATEILGTLKGAGFWKIAGNEITDISQTVKTFLALSVEDRIKHAREYGPMCIWDVSGATNFREACKQFRYKREDGDEDTATFNSDLYWDTSAATTMHSMFLHNDEFKGDLSTWDVRNVENMRQMFMDSGIENSGIGRWDVRSLQTAQSMFANATDILPSLSLSGWNIGNCSGMHNMFKGSSVTDNGIATWKLRADAKTDEMFALTKFTNPLLLWSKEHRDKSKNPAAPAAPAAAKFGGSPKSLEENVRDLFASALREQPDGAEDPPGCAVQ